MDRVGGVIALALTACVLFSFSAMLQQRASVSGPSRSGGLAGLRGLMSHLLQSPLWTLGFAVNIVGFVVQAFALQQGSVTLVQPLMPTQLVFAVGFAAWTARQWPTAFDWLCTALIIAGVATVVAYTSGHPVNPEAALERVPYVVGFAVAYIVTAMVVAHGRSPRLAALITASAAGTTFAMTALFLKLTVDRIAEGGLLHAVSWTLVALVCSTLVATTLTQAAFAAGPLPWAIAIMTIVNPVASYAAGTLAFHAPRPKLEVVAVAAALLIAGVIGLVRSSSAHGWSPARELEPVREPVSA